jgi:hypothetical protein
MAELKRYRVTAEVTISVTCIVEATDGEHAKRIATEADRQQLCNGCSKANDPEHPEWRASELDGEPQITEVEEDDG